MRNWPRRLLQVVLLGLAITARAAEPRTFAITDFGAVADEKTSNTGAIAKAIDAAVRAGGGVVRVPGGKWLTGAIDLKSNVTLDLDNNATLLMSTNPDDYPVVLTRWEGVECYNFSGMVGARDATAVAITGHGTIDGQGQAWWRWVKSAPPARRRLWELGQTTTGPHDRIFGTVKDALRPSMVQFINCKNVRVEGVKLKDSPMWSLHPIYCQDVSFKDLYVFAKGPNTDGIDLDSCGNVTVERCTIESGDDCLAIKSGRDADGRRVNRPCENITIRDCKFQRGYGGIVIGSETSGGVNNVTATGCSMRGTVRGVRIKTMRGRGASIDNVTLSNLTMKELTGAAIEIDMQYNPTASHPADDTTPALKNLTIADVDCESAKQAAVIRGLPESPVEGLTLRKVKIRADRGITAELVTKATLEDVEISAKDGPALAADRPVDWKLQRFGSGRAPKSEALVFKNSQRVTVRGSNAPESADPFLRVSGKDTTEIRLIDCDTSKAKRRTDVAGDVPKGAVTE